MKPISKFYQGHYGSKINLLILKKAFLAAVNIIEVAFVRNLLNMMRRGLLLFALCVMALVVACKEGRKSAATADVDDVGISAAVDINGLVTVDVAAEYPTQEIFLQSIADVEYIPLAISPEVLLSSSDRVFFVSDRYIMVSSIKTDRIYIFDRAGKIVLHFSRQGRGPGEYFALGDVVFDEEAQEFFVFDRYLLTTKILVYSFDGKHKRTLTLPYKCVIDIYNFDANTMLAYDISGVAYDEDTYNTTPYYLISKTDGSITETLPIDLLVRYGNVVVTRTPGEDGITYFSSTTISISNNRLGGKDLTLADMSSDTVYRFTRERVLTPAFVRTPSVHASEPRTVWSAELVTDKSIVFSIVPLIFKEGKIDSRLLQYDNNTGRVSDVTFIDGNWPSRSWGSAFESGVSPNVSATMLNPLRLVEAREKGELSGSLAEIAADMKEDDNPVVMIVKFKQ